MNYIYRHTIQIIIKCINNVLFSYEVSFFYASLVYYTRMHILSYLKYTFIYLSYYK